MEKETVIKADIQEGEIPSQVDAFLRMLAQWAVEEFYLTPTPSGHQVTRQEEKNKIGEKQL